jgi:foldase protein PrsA
MTQRLRRTLALCAFFVLPVAIAACGSGIPGDSVADMAGNPITLRAFNHWMFVAAKSQSAQNPGAPVIVPNDPPNFTHCVAQVRRQVPSLAKTSTSTLRSDCKQLFTSLSGEVMDFLIKAYWYQAEAARLGIKVTNAQVQRVFLAAKRAQFANDAQYRQFLAQTGQTQQDILFRFRINQIFQKLIARHTKKVTPQAIAQYYRAHLSQFGTPETRNIRIVLAKTISQARAAKAALSSGQSWKAVAKKYSTDPTSKNNGGLLIGVTKGQEEQALDRVAFAAREGVLLGPIKGQFGYYILEVVKITKATQQTLAQATPLIEQTLTGQLQANSQQAVDAEARKHWLGQTKCRPEYMMADCSGYKAPKSAPGIPTTGAPTTGTPTTGTR